MRSLPTAVTASRLLTLSQWLYKYLLSRCCEQACPWLPVTMPLPAKNRVLLVCLPVLTSLGLPHI